MKKIFTFLLLLTSFAGFSQSTTIVISQVYGAGGNTGAVYTADYVELHNISSTAQSLDGLSLQYSSATGTVWTGVTALPNVSIPAGGYFLIQTTTPGANGIAIPTADYMSTPTIALSGSSGKLALVTGTTALTSCTASNIIDFVGYGSANCSETSPTGVLSSADAALRNNNGCTDTNNNSTDFTVGAPAPRNSATAVFVCSGTPPPVPTITAGTVTDFGNVLILTNSASQSFNISGTNLTGAPGTITITAPSTNFQVSNDNTTWGASTTIPYTSATMASTTVYVRFTPQSVGLKTGNISITGGGTSAAVLVAVRGTGIDNTPALSTGTLTDFGNVCVNTTGGPNSFTFTANNLTAGNLTFGPLAGFTFSETAGGTFTPTLNINQVGGNSTGTVYVLFNPTAVQSYNGNIPVSGGGITPVSVAVTASGVNSTPDVTTGSASAITFTSATLGGSIAGSGCSPFTAYGIAYSTVSGFTTGTNVPSTNISGGSFTSNVSGLSPATTYYYKAYATNAGGTAYGMEMSFVTAAPSMTSTTLAPFGNVCVGNTGGPNSFTLSASDLTTADVVVGPLNGFTFSTSATGPFSPVLTITQPGGNFSQEVFVNFTPDAGGIYNGDIPVSGGGTGSSTVAVTASSDNIPAVVTTAPVPAELLSPVSARLSGQINDPGCGVVLEYGILYSGISGFPNAMANKAISNNLGVDIYSVDVTNLAPATTYFYKAYARTAGGTSYGEEQTFTTGNIPDGLTIYNNPVVSGGNMHVTINNIVPDHYGLSIYNMSGQLVFRKDFRIQLNFFDETFYLPATLGKGVYTLHFDNYKGLKIRKPFMIK